MLRARGGEKVESLALHEKLEFRPGYKFKCAETRRSLAAWRQS